MAASSGGGVGLIDVGYGVGQGGTIFPQGGTLAGSYSVTGTITASSGGMVLPYGTATPTLTTAGQAAFYLKGGTFFLGVRYGGGTYVAVSYGTASGTVTSIIGTTLP